MSLLPYLAAGSSFRAVKPTYDVESALLHCNSALTDDWKMSLGTLS